MIGRWAGIRGPGRKNNNPNENIMSREEHVVNLIEYKQNDNYNIGQETTDDSDVVTEPPRTISVHDRCDVLVVGGGPSGIII